MLPLPFLQEKHINLYKFYTYASISLDSPFNSRLLSIELVPQAVFHFDIIFMYLPNNSFIYFINFGTPRRPRKIRMKLKN